VQRATRWPSRRSCFQTSAAIHWLLSFHTRWTPPAARHRAAASRSLLRILLLRLPQEVRRRSDRQDRADRLDSVHVSVLIDEGDHHFARRSSSACAKTRTPSARSRWPLQFDVFTLERFSSSRSLVVRRGAGRHPARPGAPIAATIPCGSRVSRRPTELPPLRRMLAGVVEDHPNGTLTYLGGMLTGRPMGHLSLNGPSTTGTIHSSRRSVSSMVCDTRARRLLWRARKRRSVSHRRYASVHPSDPDTGALPEQEGLQPILRLDAHRHRIGAGPDQVTHGLIRVVGHVDGAQLAGAMQTGQRQTVAAIRFHASPLRFGVMDGLTTTHASPRRIRCR